MLPKKPERPRYRRAQSVEEVRAALERIAPVIVTTEVAHAVLDAFADEDTELVIERYADGWCVRLSWAQGFQRSLQRLFRGPEMEEGQG